MCDIYNWDGHSRSFHRQTRDSMTGLYELLFWALDKGYYLLVPAFVVGGYSVGLCVGAYIAAESLSWAVAVKVWTVFVVSVLFRELFFYDLNQSIRLTLQYWVHRLDERLKRQDLMWWWQAKLYILLRSCLLYSLQSITSLERKFVGFKNWSRQDYFWRFFASRTWFFLLGIPLVSLAGFRCVPIRKIATPVILGQAVWSALVIAIGYQFSNTVLQIQNDYLQLLVLAAGSIMLIIGGCWYFSEANRKMMWKYVRS